MSVSPSLSISAAILCEAVISLVRRFCVPNCACERLERIVVQSTSKALKGLELVEIIDVELVLVSALIYQ